MKYGIKNGDIFIAADGGHYGHMVIDTEKYAYCDDIVTMLFTEDGIIGKLPTNENRIDAFKLAQVRYYKPESLPYWIPVEVLKAIEG